MADANNPMFEFLEQRFDVTNEENCEYFTELDAIKTSEITIMTTEKQSKT